jgi:integrase
MHAWTAPECARFLRWADDHDADAAMAWRAARLHRDAARGGNALHSGEQRLVEGATKTGRSRMVDLDAGSPMLDLVRDTALVLADLDGTHRSPRAVLPSVRRARGAGAEGVGEEQLPVIRPPHLRHTHATLLLAAGEPVTVVSERLGHANATITLTVYQHVHPGMGRPAAGSPPCSTADADTRLRPAKYHGGITRPFRAPEWEQPGAHDLQKHRGDARRPPLV